MNSIGRFFKGAFSLQAWGFPFLLFPCWFFLPRGDSLTQEGRFTKLKAAKREPRTQINFFINIFFFLLKSSSWMLCKFLSEHSSFISLSVWSFIIYWKFLCWEIPLFLLKRGNWVLLDSHTKEPLLFHHRVFLWSFLTVIYLYKESLCPIFHISLLHLEYKDTSQVVPPVPGGGQEWLWAALQVALCLCGQRLQCSPCAFS